jgi:N-acetylmuramoyl-L-alanine amidase
MAENYTVNQGDSIASIAFAKGFFPDTIWDHPNNEKLKNERVDPNVLFPGDIVFIPDKRLKELGKPTNEVHKFRVKNTPKTFRLQLMRGDLPVAKMEYVLEIDGKESNGSTDNDGWIIKSISPDAKKAILKIKEGEKFEMKLGFLDPVDEITGIQGRLRTLGYYDGTINGKLSDETKEALKSFQASNAIDATGEPDEKTKTALKDLVLS